MTSREVSVLAQLVRHMKNGVNDPLTPLIDTYLVKRKTSETRLAEWTVKIPERPRPGGRISPSSVGGCQRQAILKFVGYDPPRKYIDPDRELIFEDGNWRHHKWDALFYDMEKVLGRKKLRVIEYEAPVQIPNLYVAGTHDILVKIGPTRYLIDFKGANEFAFNYIHRNNKPPEEYVKQLFTYMVARKVRHGMLLFDNKNNQNFKVFTYELDPEVWAETERWIQRVIQQLERRTLPGRHQSCNNGSFLFERCPFAPFCFGEHKDDRVALRKLAFRNFEGLDEAWKAGLASAS